MPLTKLDGSRAETSHRFPSFLPDGRHFVYVVRSERAENWGISIASLDKPVGSVLTTDTVTSVQVVPSGHLLYLRRSTLVAQPFDLDAHTLTGESVIIADAVGATSTAYAAFSASRTGVLVYGSRTDHAGELRWVARNGTRAGTVGSAAAGYLDVELSPDHGSVAVSKIDEQLTTEGNRHYFYIGRRLLCLGLYF